MGGITIILNIASLGRIRQAVPEAHLTHDLRLSQMLEASSLFQRLATALVHPRGGHEGVHLTAHDARDRCCGVEASRHGAASGFDGGDSRSGCPRHDDVQWLFHDVCATAAEQFHAIARLVDAARLSQFADGDRSGRVDTALVDPFLDSVEVGRR